jgi:regulator of protease activity HflC (stomatin/prohibitin superfamily)
MSFSGKPPTNPLEALLKQAGAKMERELKKLAEQAQASMGQPKGSSGGAPPPPPPPPPAQRKPRAGAPPPPPPPIERNAQGSVLGPSRADRTVRRFVGLFVAIVVMAWIYDAVHWSPLDAVSTAVTRAARGDAATSGSSTSALSSILTADPERIQAMLSSFFSSLVPLAIFVVGIIFVIKAIRVVPQQRAFVIERLGRFHAVLEPGLRFTIPFIDRISARHDLREVPLDVPSQVCITRDNTQLQVDGILYYQVTDPKLATYGSSNYIMAITQLAQTTLRSVIGRLELDKTFEEREMINHAVVSALDEAAMNWGVKVLRYEIKDLTPPKEILHAMQQQITAEREKRALIAASEGRKQEQINIAMGQKEAAIAKSEGDKISEINQAQGEAAAILAKAEASAEAIRKIAAAIESQGGLQAVNLKVAEQYVAAFSAIAKQGNTIVVPQNLTDVAALVTAATSVIKAQK